TLASDAVSVVLLLVITTPHMFTCYLKEELIRLQFPSSRNRFTPPLLLLERRPCAMSPLPPEVPPTQRCRLLYSDGTPVEIPSTKAQTQEEEEPGPTI
ncbi:hypothetical protein U1Q18_036567, partial [Sarracenia purpurea var. burkii]